jgi:hypothetical protein
LSVVGGAGGEQRQAKASREMTSHVHAVEQVEGSLSKPNI